MAELEDIPCPTRKPPNFNIDREEIAKFAADSDVLPLYESSMMAYIYRKHYSMKTNKYLGCTWDKFMNNISSRVKAPVVLPGVSDLHFHNAAVKLLPSESINKRSNFRKSLKPGPGVDYGGQMPIPMELFMKRLGPKENIKEPRPRIKKTLA